MRSCASNVLANFSHGNFLNWFLLTVVGVLFTIIGWTTLSFLATNYVSTCVSLVYCHKSIFAQNRYKEDKGIPLEGAMQN